MNRQHKNYFVLLFLYFQSYFFIRVCSLLTAAFDTVNHNVLLLEIARSMLPEATCRWLSNYIRGRQSATSCRGVKSKARIIHTGVPQGSKLSPTLFSFYIADIPRLTEPVRRIYYVDDITVWALSEALRIITGSHKMSSIEHLHSEMRCYRLRTT